MAEVLEQAGGACGICGKNAPFARASDGTPYLEVHHTKPLAKDGDDTVENAVAACPNCHRQQHYG
ncbi:MAG: HNH endonuclease signature motif containing protein [Polaromonas sp.]|nr:HNH endonuclease signature motif containing protein [Polaromonas sp.]MDP2452268.1 HNH endonuclease signature motif containing protein [Polaromonas sp.]MDP3250179.1 HNH endonuclease signature motif containing protein [Polaromonas sp.]MDP3756671.1 HNH endonuclease signature motif containing protein [Polaromonas sp.]